MKLRMEKQGYVSAERVKRPCRQVGSLILQQAMIFYEFIPSFPQQRSFPLAPIHCLEAHIFCSWSWEYVPEIHCFGKKRSLFRYIALEIPKCLIFYQDMVFPSSLITINLHKLEMILLLELSKIRPKQLIQRKEKRQDKNGGDNFIPGVKSALNHSP